MKYIPENGKCKPTVYSEKIYDTYTHPCKSLYQNQGPIAKEANYTMGTCAAMRCALNCCRALFSLSNFWITFSWASTNPQTRANVALQDHIIGFACQHTCLNTIEVSKARPEKPRLERAGSHVQGRVVAVEVEEVACIEAPRFLLWGSSPQRPPWMHVCIMHYIVSWG